MRRRWIALAALVLGVAVLLVFAAGRIGDRQRVSEIGTTVLMPLAPLGPRDLALGDRIELDYALPAVEAALRAGDWPEQGTLRVALDDASIAVGAVLDGSGPVSGRDVLVTYRFAPSGPGLWPSDRPRLSFGDSFFLVPEGRAIDYRGARYAVLKVDGSGASVVTGLADGEGNLIRPGR